MTTLRSPRSRVRRAPKRGHYDRATIDAILDEAIVCHVGFVDEGSRTSSPPCMRASTTPSTCTGRPPVAALELDGGAKVPGYVSGWSPAGRI